MAGAKSTKKRGKSQAVKNAEANARQARRNAKQLYRDHIKTMRPYLKKLRKIDLRKSLSKSQKSFVTRAYKEYTELTTRPVKIIRSRNPERLKALQTFSGQTTGPRFDVAFYPAASPKAKVTLRKTKRGYTVKESYAGVDTSILLWDIKKLASDPDTEIARVLARTGAQLFVLKVGKYLYNGGLSRSLVPKNVKQLMAKYNDPSANNYYQNWLIGLEAYQGTDRDISARRQEYRAGSERAKAEKAKERRRGKKTNTGRPRKRSKRATR